MVIQSLRTFILTSGLLVILLAWFQCSPSNLVSTGSKTVLEGVWHTKDNVYRQQVDRMIRFQDKRYLDYRWPYSYTDTLNGQYLHLHINQSIIRGTFELRGDTLVFERDSLTTLMFFTYSLSISSDSLYLNYIGYSVPSGSDSLYLSSSLDSTQVFTRYAGEFFGVDEPIFGE